MGATVGCGPEAFWVARIGIPRDGRTRAGSVVRVARQARVLSPPWVFAPVWIVLCALMGIAAGLGWASLDIIVLAALVVAWLVASAPIVRASRWLIAPYLAWVLFATAVTLTIWRMNG
jgi:tryptophan-rich sensory protein